MLKENEPLLQELLAIEEPEIFWQRLYDLPSKQLSDICNPNSEDRQLLTKFAAYLKQYGERYTKYKETIKHANP